MKYDGSKGLELIMVCSTIHVTPDDLDLMAIDEDIIAYPNEYGVIVYVPQLDWELSEELWHGAGFTEYFRDVMCLARQKGATWVKFDTDGFRHPELKQLTEEWK